MNALPTNSTGDRAVVTIIRDPSRPLGKRFTRRADGAIDRKAEVSIGQAEAVMRHVPTPEAFAEVLREVTSDPQAALILDRVDGIEVGVPFVIMSEKQLADRLSGKRGRSELIGVHRLRVQGEERLVVGRFKDNFLPGIWCLADRDVDAHTPAEFADPSYERWVAQIDRLLPGFADADRVHVESSSARVTHDGVPVGAGNGHTFFRVSDPDDLHRARVATRLRAIELRMSWLKPKYSKTTGEVCGHADATVLDLSTWIAGRLVFDGAPTASSGLAVNEAAITVHSGSRRSVDTSPIELPDAARVRELCKPMGLELSVSGDGPSLKVDAYNLRSDTVLETEDFGEITVATALLARSEMRVQAPFRASESMAGKLNFDHDGRPFVHDVGTGTNHWLAQEEWDAIRPDVADEFEDLTTPQAIAAAQLAEEASAKAKAVRFEPTPWHAFSNGPAPTWIVRDILPQAELAVIYGESGSGKTFFALDLVAAVARGVEWRGRRVKQGRVVYVAAEGVAGFRNRMKAYAMAHGTSDGEHLAHDAMQLDVISQAPDLLGTDHQALAVAIGKASVVVVDTLAQTTPGANENSGEDMGKALAHCKAIHAATGALVVLIHHSGKDQSRGARGWSGIRAACDAEIEITNGGDVRSARVTKQKDGEQGAVLSFALASVAIDVDEDGATVTSCIVAACDAPPVVRPEPKGDNQKTVWAVARKALADAASMPRESLIAQAVERMPEPAEGKSDRRRDVAVRAIKALIEQGYFAEEGDDLAIA
jgi:hypothetical protein